MRVLFSGAFNPAFEALPEGVIAGFRQSGHQVSPFNHRAYHLPGRLRARVRGLDRWDRAALNRRIVRLARRVRPQLILVNQGSVITAETMTTLRREIGTVTANWWSDYPAEFEDGLELARAGAYDLFYVSGTDAQDRHREAGVRNTRWLPFGCDPETHRPVTLTAEEKARYGCRVAFVGSFYPERLGLLARLADLGLAVWGPGWEAYRNDPEIGPCVRGGPLRPLEWRRVYSAADIVLNVSYGFDGPAETYGTMANVRIFEALACGACLVTDSKRDIHRLFDEGRHLALYRDVEEARGRVIELLDDPEQRAAMSEEGRRHVQSRHTWRRRVERVIREMESLRPDRAVEIAS